MSLHRSDRSRRDVRPLLRLTAAAAAGVTLMSACVSSDKPGVDVQSLQADVVFGVELAGAETPILPPTAVPIQGESGSSSFGDGTLRVPFRNPVADRLPTFDVAAPTGECPRAPLGASPDLAAPEVVDSLPREGLYRWQREIRSTLSVAGVEVNTDVVGSESRLIRNVRELGAGTDPTAAEPGRRYTYEVVRPDLAGNTAIESWFVNTAPVNAGVNSPQGIDPGGVTEQAEGLAAQQGLDVDVPDEVQESLPTGNRVRVGEPNRGLVYQGEALVDGNGMQIGGFNPSPPLLYLPLNVQAGDFWTSTGIDPRTGEIRRVEGIVAERQFVDACGVLLDGWLVELDETRAVGTATITRHSELVVSTQYGAVVIGETFTEEGPFGTIDASFRVGQKDPSPIPEELRT